MKNLNSVILVMGLLGLLFVASRSEAADAEYKCGFYILPDSIPFAGIPKTYIDMVNAQDGVPNSNDISPKRQLFTFSVSITGNKVDYSLKEPGSTETQNFSFFLNNQELAILKMKLPESSTVEIFNKKDKEVKAVVGSLGEICHLPAGTRLDPAEVRQMLTRLDSKRLLKKYAEQNNGKPTPAQIQPSVVRQ